MTYRRSRRPIHILIVNSESNVNKLTFFHISLLLPLSICLCLTFGIHEHLFKIWKFPTSPSTPTFLKWWYIDTAISLGFLRTWTIFPPFSIYCFGSHRIRVCVLKILGDGKLCAKLKSGIASKNKHSIGSLEYSAFCFSSIDIISHAQCVPKQKQNKKRT